MESQKYSINAQVASKRGRIKQTDTIKLLEEHIGRTLLDIRRIIIEISFSIHLPE